ncbi:LuxR C-terminal-related transcriptional regulator [Yersinia proxima]|uniref:LuxR C-terminal-related transcriptional regulator n=1 Tax=Yersinia proxima TaxID=2890316 RepID=UPI001D125A8F|nr:LuxR C-terminal-related transcriptional regulator [Yersinia proxima]
MPITNNNVLKLAIMDPYPLNRLGLKHITLALEPGICIEAEGSCFKEIAQILQSTHIDILVTELYGEQEDLAQGVTMLQALCLIPDLRIIIYTQSKNGQVLNMLNGFKQISLISHFEALEPTLADLARALANEKICSSLIQGYIEVFKRQDAACLRQLTRCERNILILLFNGYSLVQISHQINRSIKTVSCHKCNAMRKLGAKSDADLYLVMRDLFNR